MAEVVRKTPLSIRERPRDDAVEIVFDREDAEDLVAFFRRVWQDRPDLMDGVTQEIFIEMNEFLGRTAR